LTDNVLIQMGHDVSRRGDLVEELLAGAAPPPLLVQNGLAKLDALAANVNVARPFHERTDVPITLAAERTERVLLCRAPASFRTRNVPTRGHVPYSLRRLRTGAPPVLGASPH